MFALVLGPALQAAGIPDRIVVLTFDDSIKSHYTVAGPLLKQYGFGATFFVTEGFEFKTDKEKYMTWEEIASLHRDGFEIGNHTRDHMGLSDANLPRLREQVEAINAQCEAHGIPRPTSFAYPGNAISDGAIPALAELGFTFARRGGAPERPYENGEGFAYQPGLDHPLLIPSAGDSRPHWELDNFIAAVSQARYGRIAVLQFHGVPDRAHAWVHTPRERFEQYLKYLADHDYTVIALRDLARYVDPEVAPNNPQEVIVDRKRLLESGESLDALRQPESAEALRYWLETMVGDYGYDLWEVRAATGLDLESIAEGIERWSISGVRGGQAAGATLKIRPYPGGRHPRIAFLDGAMRPQRETKFGVFAPWENGGYAVVDVPEAIWMNTETGRELLYLAHTHVPTHWSRKGVALPPLEWERAGESVLEVERVLPNQVAFGARVEAQSDHVLMDLWLRNGSGQPLSGLAVQNCVMLKALDGFSQRSNDRQVYQAPYAASPDGSGQRWVITGWEHCQRPWGNANCPCLHADPRFPDCPPGETRELRGIVSFYQGTDIEAEFQRLDKLWGAPER